jgi:hypothetical protein
MSVIGSPAETSLLQAAQAQQTASKARDKEKARSESAQRFQDQVELRVAGAESDAAVRKLPQNESELAEREHASRDLAPQAPDDGPDDAMKHIDVTA